ncbi:hypothetical protein DL546_009377 [Coniochaeta pulveracea]|uniref:WSC domain-containing protein n=1 Tax=Coniochaeta pulveracea TaxID=177199 RepID=A0A420YKN7_9PEZI|nr:hypothetical protein DL546_009377 [Coniochaeta pulveracea]
MTPELCLSAANSIGAAKPTPTKFPFVYIEYHGECYGGTSLDFKSSAVTSLYGANACTDWCSGSRIPYTTNGVVKTSTRLDNRCGGAKQFNLYAAQSNAPLPTTGGAVTSAQAP